MRKCCAYCFITIGFFIFGCADEQGSDSTSDQVQASARIRDPMPNATYQAEEYSDMSSGSRVTVRDVDDTSSGYIDLSGEGTWFEWEYIDGGPGGNCTLAFHYALQASSNRPCEIVVNGVVAGDVQFAPTGSWDTWSTDVIDVHLNSGMNTVRIKSKATEDGPSIDKLDVRDTSNPKAPNADFIYTIKNKSVKFTDKSNDPSGSISNRQWKFGDGATSTQRNPTHTYLEYGIYNVELTVTNNAGEINSRNINIFVSKNDPYNYCISYARHSDYEWIGRVKVGSYSHSSGPSSYSNLTSEVISLQSNSSYTVTLTPRFSNQSFSEHWRVWIDFNQDGDFNDAGERVITKLSGNSTVSANIQIPASAANITTRMRVSMRYNAAPNACKVFDGGEVEDYTVQISGGGSTEYCISKSEKFNSEWIQRIKVGSFSNSSGSSGYTDFTSKVINLSKGQKYSVKLTPDFNNNSYNEYWRMWIDFNQDGDFSDAKERVITNLSGNSTVSTNINIPSNALTGKTRMRVSMKYYTVPTACEIFKGGEVEDYTVNIMHDGGSNSPNADFTFGVKNNTAFFSDKSNDPDGYISNWYWEFGDGSTSNQQNPSHTYSYDNTYNVKLTVTDNSGLTSSIARQVVIGGGSPVEYCNSESNNWSYEWIRRVAIGSLVNSSGASGYTNFTSKVVQVTQDEYYSMTLTPQFSNQAFNENWRVWIDFNQDGDFSDANERVITTLSGKSTVTANIYIPANAVIGKTRMRVSMKYKDAPAACEIFDGGEVEDYTIDIGYGGLQGYCASRSQNNKYEWIRQVAIGSYYHNSGASVYSDFTYETININRGQSYSMKLTPQFSGQSYYENWRVWIDFNQDGDFVDAKEQIITTLSGKSTVSKNIYIPSNAYLGKTRMRVSMKYKESPTACEVFEGGEVEDYTVNIY